jgi:hypothetical protein
MGRTLISDSWGARRGKGITLLLAGPSLSTLYGSCWDKHGSLNDDLEVYNYLFSLSFSLRVIFLVFSLTLGDCGDVFFCRVECMEKRRSGVSLSTFFLLLL